MLLIFEVALFFAGLYALITSKIPGILIGWNKNGIENPKARIVGILLMLPIPVAFTLGFILALFMGKDGMIAGTCIEYILIIICFGAAIININKIKKEEYMETNKLE